MKIVLFSKLSNSFFHLKPLGTDPRRQDRGAKTRPQGQLECANPRGSPGGWSGLGLTDTLTLSDFEIISHKGPRFIAVFHCFYLFSKCKNLGGDMKTNNKRE